MGEYNLFLPELFRAVSTTFVWEARVEYGWNLSRTVGFSNGLMKGRPLPPLRQAVLCSPTRKCLPPFEFQLFVISQEDLTDQNKHGFNTELNASRTLSTSLELKIQFFSDNRTRLNLNQSHSQNSVPSESKQLNPKHSWNNPYFNLKKDQVTQKKVTWRLSTSALIKFCCSY